MSWSECANWVDKYRQLITKHERRYSAFSPYDVDDFIQEAYIVAHSASQKFPVGSRKFASTFWYLYKGISRTSLATNPNLGDVQTFPSEGGPELRKPVFFESFDEIQHSKFNELPAFSFLEDPPTDIHRTMILLTKFLLKNQRDVFVTVLGLSGRGALNFTEAAVRLGRRKDEVCKIYNNSCKRLKRLVDEGKIKINSFPRMVLVSLDGGKKGVNIPPNTTSGSKALAHDQQCENDMRVAAV